MYADDKRISYSSRSITDLTNAINSDFQNLSLWLQRNKLTPSVVKTHCTIFSTEPKLRRLDCDNSITINFPSFK